MRVIKRFLILLVCVPLTACSGSDDTNAVQPTITVTTSVENVNAPQDGGTYLVDITTTGKDWGAYSENDFITISTQNTTSQSGVLTIVVAANPMTSAREGSVTIMSGTARKNITVTQAAAAQPAYNAPDGYTLVWQDEFEGTSNQLNAADWTHEVKNSGWVNHELQNYVNQKTPEGQLVTEVKNGTLRITARKENGKIYSGRVYAKQKSGWTYGYIEASIKLPKGKGTWPCQRARAHGLPSG